MAAQGLGESGRDNNSYGDSYTDGYDYTNDGTMAEDVAPSPHHRQLVHRHRQGIGCLTGVVPSIFLYL
jgi:hypothetical protein